MIEHVLFALLIPGTHSRGVRSINPYGSQNNGSPLDTHVLIPGTYEYAILHSNKDFAEVIKLRILMRGDYPGLFEWAQCNHKAQYKGKREAR